MSRWVRLWDEMPTDPKWRVVRHRASQSVTGINVCTVVGVFSYMLAKSDKNGNLLNWCDEDVAAALELETEQVSAIFEAMQGKVLDGNYLKGWNNRQPEREDSSTMRMRASRARRDALKNDVTNVTQRDAPEEKRLEVPFYKKGTQKTRAHTRDEGKISLEGREKIPLEGREKIPTEQEFDLQFWKFYPHKVGKPAARRAFESAAKRADTATILAGLERYIRDKPPDRSWCNPATWLNQDRWADEPAKPGEPGLPMKPLNGHEISPQIFVKEGTDAWNAWEIFYRRQHSKPPPKTIRAGTMDQGWYFPTEYPPPN